MYEVVRNNIVISKHRSRNNAQRVMNSLMKKESRDLSIRNDLYSFIGWNSRITTTGVYCVRKIK